MIKVIRDRLFIIIAVIFALLVVFGVIPSKGQPNSGEYKSLKEKMNTLTENEVENPRTKSTSTRKASENKRPWEADSLHEMETVVWPDFGGREYPDWDFRPPELAEGPGEFDYLTGCAFYQPNITDNCEVPYIVRMGVMRGVLVDYKISGQGTGEVKAGTGNMGFIIHPYSNAPYGSEVKVEAWTKALSDGEVDDGYCKTTVQLLCENICECTGVEPTIVASSAEIVKDGGTVTAYVDSGGLACPPYTWTVSDSRYSISSSQTNADSEEVTITSPSGTCGTDYDVWITVTVTDNCGVSYEGTLRNTAGSWVTKALGSGACLLSGIGTYLGSATARGCQGGGNTCSSGAYYELIVGNKKQSQMTCYNSGGAASCEDTEPYCTNRCDYCPEFATDGCDNCIDPDPLHTMPCTDDGGYRCFSIGGLTYYEWECP